MHWLGTGFDPTLRRLLGTRRPARPRWTSSCGWRAENADRIDGIKFSLLDDELEKEFRRRLPAGVKVFTGDDYGYTDLLRGDGEHHSHGLLGVLDPIAPIASTGFRRSGRRRRGRVRRQ